MSSFITTAVRKSLDSSRPSMACSLVGFCAKEIEPGSTKKEKHVLAGNLSWRNAYARIHCHVVITQTIVDSPFVLKVHHSISCLS
jgi:hypothetical protein